MLFMNIFYKLWYVMPHLYECYHDKLSRL